MKNCCRVSSSSRATRKCKRKDGKVFRLPRRFTKKQCRRKVKGFSMRSSCAPYKYCRRRKTVSRK